MLHGISQGYRPALIAPLRVTSPVLTAMPQSGIKCRGTLCWRSEKVGIRMRIRSRLVGEAASANRAGAPPC